MQQLVSTGAVSKLPEEAQWNIRVLLPRKSDAPVATFTVPAARTAAPTIPAPVADPAAATAAMLSLLLNQPNGMVAQQVLPVRLHSWFLWSSGSCMSHHCIDAWLPIAE